MAAWGVGGGAARSRDDAGLSPFLEKMQKSCFRFCGSFIYLPLGRWQGGVHRSGEGGTWGSSEARTFGPKCLASPQNHGSSKPGLRCDFFRSWPHRGRWPGGGGEHGEVIFLTILPDRALQCCVASGAPQPGSLWVSGSSDATPGSVQ